jgi:hypothetical protein
MAEAPECPVCLSESYVDPVTLSCGHCTCFPCVMETRASNVETANLCPVCFCKYDRITIAFLTGKDCFSSVSKFYPVPRITGNDPRAAGALGCKEANGLSSCHSTF